MKNTTKRGLSLILVLAMCISLLSGITLTASAASYVYNWGERGVVATELSDYAIDFYADNNITYSDLAALSGSSDTVSAPSSALYYKLRELVTDNQTYTTSYDATKNLFMYTDCQNGGGKISSFYSGTGIGPAWDSSEWNREHTWPNSKGDDNGSGENDIMMLRPTATSENGGRSNTAYGEGSEYYDPNSESNGALNLHGDVARIILYVYVRWRSTSVKTSTIWGTDGVMESKDVLLKWMEEDPVDTWELGRNDAVQSITGTRNVFVDYPELGFLLFNEAVPADYQTPSDSTNTTNYSITAYSNNNTYGTVSLSGKTITAVPAEGYYAAGYSVTSGSAVVTQSGNTFVVAPGSDCAIMINFAAKTTVSVSFSGASGVSSQSGYAGETMTLPTATAPENYTFLGWTTSALSSDTNEKPTYYTDSFVPVQSTTLYALYSYVKDGTGSASGDYIKVTKAPADWSGEYVIVYEDNGYIFDSSLEKLDAVNNYQAITISNDTISATQADDYRFTVVKTDSGYTIQGSNGLYIGRSTDQNGLDATTSAVENTITINSDGSVNIIGTGGSYLRFNATSNQNRFRYYASGSYKNQKAIALYVRDGASGNVYYTSNPRQCEHNNIEEIPAVEATCSSTGLTSGIFCNDCQSIVVPQEVVPMTDHENLEIIPAQAPSCTETGLSEGIYCNDCQSVVVAQEIVAATGHSYNAVVTPPTTNTQGYTTYTCSVCGSSYVGDYTEALGEVYTVSFCVPSGVGAVADMECGKNGITLPSAGVPTGDHAYVFAGWAAEQVEDTETAPTLYTDTYAAKEDTTLYAVYTYAVGGSGAAEYVLTDISEITETDTVVVTMTYTDGTVYALPHDNGSSKAPAGVIVTVANNKLTAEPEDRLKWNIGGNSSGYIFYPEGTTDTWLYSTSTNNGTRVGTNANKTFVVDAASGYLKHVGTNRYLGVYRTNPDWRCYTNTTGNTANQTLGFYVKTQSGTTYYTSLDSAKVIEAAVYTGSTLSGEYASFNDAVAACADGQYIKLLADAEAEVILEADLYIDLNGYSISGILEPDGYQIYGMDSTTDSYNGDSVGYFDCYDVNDQAVVPQTHFKSQVTGSIKRYMAVASDAGYSFHRFYLGITHVSIKAATTGVGYKAVFAADETLQQYIEGFGYSLQLESYDVLERSLDDFVSKKVVALRVENFDLEGFGEAVLTAGVYMTVNGEKICSDTVSYSMKNMLEAASADLSGFNAEQILALQSMIAPYADTVMAQWEIEAIKQWTNN